MDDGYLADSGVFVRWFAEQEGWQHARRVRADYLSGTTRLETVDLVRFEVGDVLRRIGLLPGVLDRGMYVGAARAIDDFGVVVHVSDAEALERAARLSADRMVSFYDAVVVDRALQRNLTLLTSDARLTRAVSGLLSTELLEGIGG